MHDYSVYGDPYCLVVAQRPVLQPHLQPFEYLCFLLCVCERLRSQLAELRRTFSQLASTIHTGCVAVNYPFSPKRSAVF
jgi:hypothetical protein